MTVDDQRAAAELAAGLFGGSTSPEDLTCADAPEIGGFYVWQTVRGGSQMLVGRDGAVLYGHSSLSYEQMVTDYRDGMRTERSAFRR